jgi:tRNA/rRNA methyltransferase
LTLASKPIAQNFKSALCVVLVQPRNPLNIGAVARAMANFGYSQLRLVAPYEPSFHEARSAVGAGELLGAAQVYDNITEATADCHVVIGTTAGTNRKLKQPATMLPDAAPSILQALMSQRVAILFGSEKRGLSNQDLGF